MKIPSRFGYTNELENNFYLSEEIVSSYWFWEKDTLYSLAIYIE